jgi:hypothetical protein
MIGNYKSGSAIDKLNFDAVNYINRFEQKSHDNRTAIVASYKSGKRDSNPRPRPWEGRTLPLSYSRVYVVFQI